MLDLVTSCQIVPLAEDNTSDHLPVQCSLRLRLPPKDSTDHNAAAPHEKHPRLNWDLPEARAAYQLALDEQLASLVPIDLNIIQSADGVSTAIDSYANSLTAGMHHAVSSIQSRFSERSSGRRKKHWWTVDCTTTRDRMRVFFHIWKSCGRPSQGAVFDCYKEARRTYRKACRTAVRSHQRQFHQLLTRLYHARRPGQFWNLLRKSRTARISNDDIGIEDLRRHFESKFAAAESPSNDYITEAQETVNEKFAALAGTRIDITVSESKVRRLMKKMRKGCSPGVDGIVAEHLRYGLSTSLPFHLAILLTLCLRFGSIPDTFRTGLLVPILKKPHLDPSKLG